MNTTGGEFAEFKTRIGLQSEKYAEAYGTTGKTYEEGKMKDLYTRLGNAILKEVRTFDAEQKKPGTHSAARKSRKHQKKDPYTRLGNAIQKGARTLDAEQRELAAAAGENRQEYTKQIAGVMSLASAVNRMRKGLKSEWEKARNEREHNQMMRYDAEKEIRGHE